MLGKEPERNKKTACGKPASGSQITTGGGERVDENTNGRAAARY